MIPASFSLARNMARKVLKQYKIVEVPTDLQRICEAKGLEYVELDDPEELDGMLLELEDGTRVAMVNKAKSYVRGRFTLAHELGHYDLKEQYMKKGDCEICKHWAASQSDDFPCDECDGKSYFEYADAPTLNVKM